MSVYYRWKGCRAAVRGECSDGPATGHSQAGVGRVFRRPRGGGAAVQVTRMPGVMNSTGGRVGGTSRIGESEGGTLTAPVRPTTHGLASRNRGRRQTFRGR